MHGFTGNNIIYQGFHKSTYHKQRKFGTAKVCGKFTFSIKPSKPNLAKKFADILDKFAKLNATKSIVMQFRQTLATPNLSFMAD